MARKKTKKAKLPLLFYFIALFITVAIGFTSFKNSSQTSKIASNDSLQIGYFIPERTQYVNPIPTPTPTKTQTSPPTVFKPQPGGCVGAGGSTSDPNSCCDGLPASECSHTAGGCTGYICSVPCVQVGDNTCVDKPVIYLYPEKPTVVNVEVKTEGKIVISDPLYPEGGWKNILAEPSGKLTYLEKTYGELFYESSVNDVKKSASGLTLDSKNLKSELDYVITKLGLIGAEKTEFLDFWVPRLNNLKSRYVFFGLVEKNEKDRIDKVLITPEPDTFIEILAYFAPLDKPFEGKKLELPSAPPERIGFTAVEWGGSIIR